MMDWTTSWCFSARKSQSVGTLSYPAKNGQLKYESRSQVDHSVLNALLINCINR